MSEAKKLLAFVVMEDGEGYCCVVFERSNAAARRIGANELNSEFEYVTCRREPSLDQFAEAGKVPPQFLIENLDFWFECAECSTHAPNRDDDGNPSDPEYEGDLVFCNAGCKNSHKEGIRRRTHLVQQRKADCLAKFPGVDVVYVSSHDSDSTVTFRFPGGKQTARWQAGSTVARVAQEDVQAFEIYKSNIPASAAMEQKP